MDKAGKQGFQAFLSFGEILSPHPGNIVHPDAFVSGHERQIFDLRLGDQHPVEWVIVVPGEGSRTDGMLDFDGKGHKPICFNGRPQVTLKSQLPQRSLYS